MEQQREENVDVGQDVGQEVGQGQLVVDLVEAEVTAAPVFLQQAKCNTEAVILAAIANFVAPAGTTR